jgi:hypothetical protein
VDGGEEDGRRRLAEQRLGMTNTFGGAAPLVVLRIAIELMAAFSTIFFLKIYTLLARKLSCWCVCRIH